MSAALYRLPVLQPIHQPGEPGRRRRVSPRARTITTREIQRDVKGESAASARADVAFIGAHARPKVRGDCAGREMRCPWVSCAFHLYLDVNEENGSVKLNFPHLGVEEMPVSCALIVAEMVRDAGEMLTLEATGMLTNMTRERIRQIETRIKRKLRAYRETAHLAEFLE